MTIGKPRVTAIHPASGTSARPRTVGAGGSRRTRRYAPAGAGYCQPDARSAARSPTAESRRRWPAPELKRGLTANVF
ncbi:hypothetical protein KCP69_04515 [Salmonella enterica subsp. enterica]|nr:hypothetical protein KCP69_04515 [Salmonella enterica subsp. enterica]